MASDDDDDDDEPPQRSSDEPPQRSSVSGRRVAGSARRPPRRVIEDDEEDDDDAPAAAGADVMADVTFSPKADEDDDDDEVEESESEGEEEEEAPEGALDEITKDELLKLHIVWRSPDGSSTLRFNLSTMKKIAHRAGEWRQPPHFRAKMSEALERQIRRKWGDRALRLAAPDGGSSSSQAAANDDGFAWQFAEWQYKRLSEVGDLHACPICMLWLKCCAHTGERSPAAALRRLSAGDGEALEEMLDRSDEPLSLLFSSSRVRDWEERCAHAFPPEAAAAQCCFRSRAALVAHLRDDHHLAMNVIRSRDNAPYFEGQMFRTPGGLVQKWIGKCNERPGGYGTNSNAMQLYWRDWAAAHDDEAEPLHATHAALFHAVYDEACAPRRAEPLFESSAAASQEAWDTLGWTVVDDSGDENFVADSSDEEVDDDPAAHAAARLEIERREGRSDSDDDDDNDPHSSMIGFFSSSSQGGGEALAPGWARRRRDSDPEDDDESDGYGEEGEDDVEYDNTPDALDVAEQAMRERKRGGGTSRKRRRGESSSARRRPSRQAVREEDEEEEEEEAPKKARRAVLSDDDDD